MQPLERAQQHHGRDVTIERIEVLQDGAAAQYGSDAIAGVLNVILKSNTDGNSLTANGGGYYDGGGDTRDLSGNIGFQPSTNSFLSITAQTRTHDRSERGGIDPRVVDPRNIASMPALLQVPGYPRVNRIQGDAEYELSLASYNAGITLSETTSLYSFGSYGYKEANALENYRTPNRLPVIYPLGFSPREATTENDYEITLGAKGSALAGWNWDLSSTYGKDDLQIRNLDSSNIALFNDTGSTPTDFDVGKFLADRSTTTLDLSRDFEVGLASPLNVAVGVEYRRETYEIRPGDAASRFKEGSQAFPGFALTDAGKHDRDNRAVYVDLALTPLERLQLDVAGRFEHFSDFGDATVGKLTGRYDFTTEFALRGTVSTGFRAPTLAEQFYSATNVSPTTAFLQLPPNAAAAALIGINGLDAEDSTNYSLGFVVRLDSGLTATLDAYQIEIDDRIVGSGSIFGAGGANNSPAVVAAIAANGNVFDPTVAQIGVNVFNNGLDTRTRGAELSINYADGFEDDFPK